MQLSMLRQLLSMKLINDFEYEKIKKEGLKVKGNSKYRYFPSRIYLVLPNVSSSKEKD